jgi:hypothetical protein
MANMTKKNVSLCDVREHYYRLCPSETRFNGSIKIRTIQFPSLPLLHKVPLIHSSNNSLVTYKYC